MDTSIKSDEGRHGRARRRIRTLAEKLSILAEVDKPSSSIAEVARRHDMNANLLFAWRRLHGKGLLEGQRHAPPLLPVRITSPTITPTERARAVPEERGTGASATPDIEIVLFSGVRIQLRGQAQKAVLASVLSWLSHR